jgi:hypothetical protein
MAFPSNPSGARRSGKTSTSSNQLVFEGETIAVTTAQLALNTLLGSIRIPKGAEIVSIILAADAMDSNGSPTLTMSIGDAASDSRLLAANSTPRAGGVVNTPARGAVGYQYTADTLVQVKVKAAAATAVAGTLQYGVFYVTN